MDRADPSPLNARELDNRILTVTCITRVLPSKHRWVEPAAFSSQRFHDSEPRTHANSRVCVGSGLLADDRGIVPMAARNGRFGVIDATNASPRHSRGRA